MICIVIHFPKGGVGKSTLAWALSSLLSEDRKVLSIDLDPQGTLTNSLITDAISSAFDIFSGRLTLAKASTESRPQYSKNLKAVAGGDALSNLEQFTAGDLDRYYILSEVLANQPQDIVIIDTPPGSASFLTVSALVAATHVISPISLDAAAFEQLPAFKGLLQQVQRRLNPRLKWAGLVPNRFDVRRCLDHQVLAAIRERNDSVVHPLVRDSVRIKETMGSGNSAAANKSLFSDTIGSITAEVYR